MRVVTKKQSPTLKRKQLHPNLYRSLMETELGVRSVRDIRNQNCMT